MNPADLAASRPLPAPLPAASEASGVASVAPDQSLHFLRKTDADEANGIGVANAFVVVLVLAGFAFWWLRRRGYGQPAAPRAGDTPWQRLVRGPQAGGLQVLQSTRLTPKASAHVLQWGDGRWLVVCNDGATTVVAQQAGPAPADPEVMP